MKTLRAWARDVEAPFAYGGVLAFYMRMVCVRKGIVEIIQKSVELGSTQGDRSSLLERGHCAIGPEANATLQFSYPYAIERTARLVFYTPEILARNQPSIRYPGPASLEQLQHLLTPTALFLPKLDAHTFRQQVLNIDLP